MTAFFLLFSILFCLQNFPYLSPILMKTNTFPYFDSFWPNFKYVQISDSKTKKTTYPILTPPNLLLKPQVSSLPICFTNKLIEMLVYYIQIPLFLNILIMWFWAPIIITTKRGFAKAKKIHTAGFNSLIPYPTLMLCSLWYSWW